MNSTNVGSIPRMVRAKMWSLKDVGPIPRMNRCNGPFGKRSLHQMGTGSFFRQWKRGLARFSGRKKVPVPIFQRF